MPYSTELKQLAERHQNKQINLSNLAKYKHPLYIQLVEETSFLPEKSTMAQRLFHVRNDTNEIPTCKMCTNLAKWHSSNRPVACYSTYCSAKCVGSDTEVFNVKRRKTCLAKYGVDSYSKTDAYKQQMSSIDTSVWNNANEKRKQSIVEKYGVEHAGQIPGSAQKRRNTNLKKYGSTNVLTSDFVKQIKIDKYGTAAYVTTEEFAEKRKISMIANHGVEYSGQSQILTDKRSKTNIERYGSSSWSNHHISKHALECLNNVEWLIDQHITQQKPSTVIAQELGVDKETIGNYMKKVGMDRVRYSASYPEVQLSQWLTSNNIEHEINNRTLLKGKELDLYIPSKNVAIEYCGLYWHSTAMNPDVRNKHLEKLTKCTQLGIRLITLFEDEWIHNQELVLEKLSNILNISNNKRVYARKCIVKDVSTADKIKFFNTNHIQGDGPSSLNIGLYYDNTLVACMGFIMQANNVYTLNRYATSLNVVGGFSKLLAHFKAKYDWQSIISFADRRWSTGNVYETNGFSCDKILPPDYDYIDTPNCERIHKFNFRHKNLADILGDLYDSTLSETENTQRAGWYRIYNCGLIRYKLDRQ